LREPLTRSIPLPDEVATAKLGEQLVRSLGDRPAGWLVLLEGELGAGKSTLARAMIRTLGHEGPVPSPTYTLVEPYEFDGFSVYHIDLYRIADEEELEFLGFSDLADGLRLIEWPERAPALLADADLVIHLAYAGAGRSATLSAHTDRAIEALSGIDLK
jgi:tRNA threonylcarbamoyladenosine biosynthesis protein TsaE